MKSVSLRTGLTAHTVRVWERRYRAVQPARSGTQRRLFSDDDVQRLFLLASLTASGHTISNIARLSDSELTRLLNKGMPTLPDVASKDSQRTMEALMQAVRTWDNASLEALLDSAAVKLGHSGLLERVLVPLLYRIGEEWHNGLLTAAQEHGASAAIRDYLALSSDAMATPSSAPRIIMTTPAGQLHELGAAIAASLARRAGWNVSYLGPSLPAAEIAGAAISVNARAVGLSIVYPADDAALPLELARLRHLLPGVLIVVGGQAAGSYAKSVQEIGAVLVRSMEDFTNILRDARDGIN